MVGKESNLANRLSDYLVYTPVILTFAIYVSSKQCLVSVVM